MLYPITFRPIFKDRVWGGRKIAELYGKSLPPKVPIGESWEISDRTGDVSVILNGPLAGKDLRWLMENHGRDLFGSGVSVVPAVFPLLIKILDAREKLSLQVHPPAARAKELNGEPKTEMWYIADAGPGAELYVGLKRGITQLDFEACIRSGGVSECFHKVPVKAGDAMFLPSGRVHAIGADLVIFEIQQNSDTTYRVYDWDRVGLDGKPRQLHIRESLASIDFNDFEPALVKSGLSHAGPLHIRQLVSDPLFEVSCCAMTGGGRWSPPGGELRILGVVKGAITVSDSAVSVSLQAGQFCLLPASLKSVQVQCLGDAGFLEVRTGRG